MKKQSTSSIKAQFVRGGFYTLLLIFFFVIRFALAQQHVVNPTGVLGAHLVPATPSSRYGRNWIHISILSAARLGPTGAASSPQFRVPRPTGSSTSNGTRCLILPATRHRTSRYACMRMIRTSALI